MIKNKRSIAKALITIVCACSMPAVIAVLMAISYHYSTSKDELVNSSVRRAAAISVNLDSTVKGIEIGLLTLASSPYLTTQDMSQFYRQANEVLSNLPGAQNVFLTDKNGQQLLNTLRPYGQPLPVTGNVKMVRNVVESGTVQISGVFRGAVAGVLLVAVAVPVRVNGAVVFVLAATIRPKSLSSSLVESFGRGDWIISVSDLAGKFIARSREHEKYVGMSVSEDLSKARSHQPSGTFEGTSREGIEVLAAFTTSSYTGWTTAVGIPKETLLGHLNRLFLAGIGVTALVMSIGLWTALIVARNIRRGIVSLIPAAEALDGSNPIHIPTQSFLETNLLASALQRSSVRLIQSEYAANHDPLTGLSNRAVIATLLPRLLELSIRKRCTLALLYLDLDGFKQVNDTLGHHAGDEVLRTAARRLYETVRSSDICIRLGGDEFAVILPDTDSAGARYIAEKILRSLAAEMCISDNKVEISVSIGYALSSAAPSDNAHLLENADSAMYQAKQAGKNRIVAAVTHPEAVPS